MRALRPSPAPSSFTLYNTQYVHVCIYVFQIAKEDAGPFSKNLHGTLVWVEYVCMVHDHVHVYVNMYLLYVHENVHTCTVYMYMVNIYTKERVIS